MADLMVYICEDLYRIVLLIMKTRARATLSLGIIIVISFWLSSIFPFTADGQQLLQTIKKRDLTIELDRQQQLQTRAQLTLPAVGDGSFPAVLLIHGSGAADMDGYIPPELSGTKTGSRIFLQIAEYLSERGFVVLRYDKRGIGENATILDANVFGNATVQSLQRDAEVALDVLMQQPEVDRGNITLLGISEGTTIAPRIAAERPDHVKNIVLMSAASQTLYDIMYANLVNRTILFAQELWDENHDGILSLEEVLAHPGAYLTVPAPSPAATTFTDNVTATDNTNTTQSITQQQWYPGLDANNDALVEIDKELIPFALALFAQTAADPWLQSHKGIAPNLIAIENLRPTTGILILQGEEDNQTYLEQALLLEQKLTRMKYPDHMIITYPRLGHTFHPAQGLLQPLGPIQEYVLADLHAWLTG
ncbi:MAG: alpha/beta fold hydrolase [Thermoproteota archaeon]|nr:alpha/beta fold hydrolase [Thermoproteota archaeon]